METANFLRTVPLFSKLDDSELVRFTELTREKAYPKGSVIVFEDDPGDSLFVVRQGRVKVVLIGEDGREVILGVLGVGEHFGELSLIDDQPRSAHVIAMEDTNLLVLRRDDFRRRVESNPLVAWALLAELARRLRRADSKIHGLALLDVPGRIAKLLLDFAQEGQSETIEKPLTHQTIAHMIGASRETVSRTVRDFQNQGLIRVERRRISVANRPALKQLAQARALYLFCQEHDAVFVVNDHADLALVLAEDGVPPLGAIGVHVGQKDLPLADVRAIVPPYFVVGVSTNNPDEARAAERDGASYVAVGDTFGTSAKEGTRPASPQRLAQVKAAVRLPVIGIGGITKDNVAEVMAAGADGVAVISAVCGAADPEAAARELIEAMGGAPGDP